MIPDLTEAAVEAAQLEFDRWSMAPNRAHAKPGGIFRDDVEIERHANPLEWKRSFYQQRMRAALLAALPHWQPPEGWQTIETAPMDGTAMLLYYPTIGIVYGNYDNFGTADWWVIWSYPGGGPDKWQTPYMDGKGDPTLWQPLPALPRSTP
jgi:hypothetical protein